MAVTSPPTDDPSTPDPSNVLKEAVNRHLAGVIDAGSPGFAPQVRIGESFEVWSLGKVDPHDPDHPKTLKQLSVFSGQYHYQIYVDGSAAAYARSALHAGGWTVPLIGSGRLAEAIDAAITRVDAREDIPEASVARILMAPAYALWAFWFVKIAPELVYIIAGPRKRPLQAGDLMPADAFIDVLRQMPTVEGVPPAPE
jgi:hypothetical protein